jgi:hypothetical protein
MSTPQVTEITIPVYWTNVKKTKANTTHLAGANFIRNCHYHIKNKLKKDLGEHVKKELYKEKMVPIKGKYKVSYYYHYKSGVSDLLNVGSASSKILNDVLQELGLVTNDNVLFLTEEHFYVGEKNKGNPHMQIRIEPIDQTSQKTESTKGNE